ncbi:MAG: T9SS type A sorting domain-containing protein [Chitinophagales bacterium]|nr:T9SS type A sorting domain-containing protein [Chitinophagales bacterium]
MRKICLLFLFVFFLVRSQAQQLVSYELIASYSLDQIDSIYTANGIPGIILPSTYGVNAYKVLYNTLDADSLPILASGALFVPVAPNCHAPLASYQHGTILQKEEVPSRLAGGEVIIGLSMAADGAVLCMPDYLGLGDSPGLHPYVHAETEARAVADLLVVSLTICSQLDITLNNQLFLIGYSQGGHATMAAHQLIQEHYSNYFTVTASAPMSGPYDLAGVQAGIISQGGEYPNPGYLPYLLLAYNSVYHIYDNVADFLVSPYDVLLPPLFDGLHSMSEVNAVMPSVPNDIIVPAVLDSFNNDPDYKLHTYLKKNNTYNWKPEAPMRMYFCEGDNDVNYLNAYVAYDTFIARGATAISLVSSGAGLDHSGCAFPSLLSGKFWLDTFRLDKIKLMFDYTFESYVGAGDGSLTAHVTGGYPPYTYQWSNGGTDSAITDLTFGIYSVVVKDSTGCPVDASIYLPVQVGLEEIPAQLVSIYPNPIREMTTIEFDAPGHYTIQLADISGSNLQTLKVTGNKLDWHRDKQPAGIYIVTITGDAGLMVRKKLVLE